MNSDSIHFYLCLLYTSDAADERSSVDLGGRRIIKKKTRYNNYMRLYISKHNNTYNTQTKQTIILSEYVT